MESKLVTQTASEVPTLAMLRAHRPEIMAYADAYGVANIRVFGSVARGDAGPGSDIDLLVDFALGHRGLDFVAFAERLETLLGHHVDVGTRIDPVIQDRVYAQMVPL
ncbi:MAG: nucleotidyltransferase family protein [Acidimicrobiales bacterium]